MSHQELENKFRQLTLGAGLDTFSSSGGDVDDKKGNNIGSRSKGISVPFEGKLKSMLKELSNVKWETEPLTADKFKALVRDMLKSYGQDIASQLLETSNIQDKITNALIVLKVLAETPHPKAELELEVDDSNDKQQLINTMKPRDLFWDMIITPNLHDTYHYLAQVIQYCYKNLQKFSCTLLIENRDHYQSTSSTGFARHQLLGLLQKAVKTLLVFMKRDLINVSSSDGAFEREDSVNYLGESLCEFVNSDADMGIDIRCSIGLAITGLVLYRFKGWNQNVVTYFEKLFDGSDYLPSLEKEEKKDVVDLLENVRRITSKDVNKISVATGILCYVEVEDVSINVAELIYLIAKHIMDLDHGTKEALNLGTARVIEMLTDKLADPNASEKILEKVSTLFGTIEFFIFSYIPGHIDAVKTCCRNILGSLTKIYVRIEEQGMNFCTSPEMIENLLKKILSKDDHVRWIALSCVTRNSSASVKVLKLEEHLPVSLLCSKRSSKNSAIESYISLMSYDFPLSDRQTWEQRWILPLFEVQPNQNHESWAQKKIIIKSILKPRDRFAQNLKIILNPLLNFVIERMNSAQNGRKDIAESTLLAAETIKMASEFGLQIDEFEKNNASDNKNTENNNKDSFKGLIPRKMLNSWLWHSNPQVRLAGASLLIETKKTSEVILADDFESLRILFKYNLMSQNPSFRQEFMSYFKKLILRLRDSQALLRRSNEENATALKQYEEFFIWIWNFFTEDEGIFTGANFGRRCLSLECLTELVGTFGDLSIFRVKSDNLKYLSWLSDTYENNKIHASEILLKLPIPAFKEETMCEKLFNESVTLCQSVKPPDSATGRYLMALLMRKTEIPKYSPENILTALYQKLEETYASICSTSLLEVACARPMYGLIRGIRMIVWATAENCQRNTEFYRSYFEKLIPLLLKYDEILFPLLGNVAPEGYLPGLPDSADDNSQVVRSITAQMLLVCSWRSMRDICLLFAEICGLLPLEGEKSTGNNQFILSFDQVSSIGYHMLYLMKNLVHRGVFEQVFVGFKTLASRLWASSNPNLCALPSKWLNEAMDEEHMSSKCITRRSAGLPFIFQALLSAECDNSTFLGDWVTRLFVRDESPINSVVRIHSMNVLRALFRDTIFSCAMMPFVPQGLRIAFRGLKSNDWTERNAGLMLYGALIRRTFGPKLNLMSAPTFFRRFPEMYDFLLGELDVCLKVLNISSTSCSAGTGDGSHSEVISINGSDFTFHLLLLLSSFSPAGRVEDEHFKLSEFIFKLRQCAACSDVEVRKLAAKAIIPFLNGPNDYSVALNIISELKRTANVDKLSLNHVHGNLIQMATIVKYITKENKCIEIMSKALSELLTMEYFSSINCPTIFEGIADVILAFENFEHQMLQFLYNMLTSVYYKRYDNSKIPSRNIVPGLLKADATISKGVILFTMSSFVADMDLSSRLCATLYHWLTSCMSVTFLEQLMEVLCNTEKSKCILDVTFNGLEPTSAVLLEALISCYVKIDIMYVGQSVVELKFLKLLSKISDGAFENCLKSRQEEIQDLTDQFLKRLISICCTELSAATTEHKRLALIMLCKLTFGTEIEIKQEYQELLCLKLLEWTDSSMDDDLRLGAALGIPSVPLSGPLLRLSVINQSRIWLTVLNLAQDDDLEFRSIVNAKVTSTSSVAACDRKSLENLVQCFLESFVKVHPLEGLTLLVGLLLKDDFEITTEDAHDDDEGRLFDKSEMNMFKEPIILAKVIKEYLVTHKLENSFQTYFEQNLTPQLSEMYELASNTKLYICSPTLSTIVNVSRMRLNSDQIDEDDMLNSSHDIFCTTNISIGSAIQSIVLNILTESLL